MTDINPYASPMSSFEAQPVMAVEAVHEPWQGLFRKGNLLVMNKQAGLPDRCVKSNQPAFGRRLRRSMSWHHPAIYLSIFAGLLIYIILAIVLQKRATIYIGLSETWVRKRRWAIFWGWMIALFGVAVTVLSMIIMGDRHNQMDWAVFGIPLGVIIFFIGCIYGSVCSRMVVQTRIDDHFVWLKGVHPDFLAELPEWPYHP
jgi:hypothetical protein